MIFFANHSTFITLNSSKNNKRVSLKYEMREVDFLIMTVLQRSLRRLCFYTYLSVHRGVPATGGCLLGGSAPGGGACSRGSAPGGFSRQTPPRDGYCCGWYASY